MPLGSSGGKHLRGGHGYRAQRHQPITSEDALLAAPRELEIDQGTGRAQPARRALHTHPLYLRGEHSHVLRSRILPQDFNRTISPPTNVKFLAAEGYTCSKWPSGRLIERLHEHCNWPVTIHRPRSLLREEDVGRSKPDIDIMQSFQNYSRLALTIPRLTDRLRIFLDLVSQRSVIYCLFDGIVELKFGLEFVHVPDEIRIDLGDVEELKGLMNADEHSITEDRKVRKLSPPSGRLLPRYMATVMHRLFSFTTCRNCGQRHIIKSEGALPEATGIVTRNRFQK